MSLAGAILAAMAAALILMLLPVPTGLGRAIILALELAGFPGVALYAPSWSGWVSDPHRPVATS